MDNDEMIEELEIRQMVDGKVKGAAGEPTRAEERESAAQEAAAELESLRSAKAAAKAKEESKTAAFAKKKSKPDPYIWGIYIMLLMISVVELFSASSSEVIASNVYSPLIRHGMFLLIGFGIVLWLQKTPYTIIKKFAWAFAIFSFGLLMLSSFAGINLNGAQRAISVAGITIQPAEIVKLAVVILLASILGKNQTRGGVSNYGVVMSAIVVIVFGASLWRNGMTNALLLMCVSICMMLIGGIPIRKFLMVLGVYLLCGGAMVFVKQITPSTSRFDQEKERQELLRSNNGAVQFFDNDISRVNRDETRKGRMSRFFKGVHPDDKIDDINRQVIFSKFSQANGGFVGKGPGNSRESARLPLAFSDYIYSIIVEDTGFVGGAAVLLLYLLLLARAGRIAYKCTRAFPAFLIMGCAVMIVFQALVHMAIVTGLFPVSGQPLPLISKGGTSILVMSAAIGIMMSVARFATQSGDERKKINAEKDALPEDMRAANFSSN